MSVRILPIFAAVATAAACGAQTSGGGSSAGLYGTVRISPATPVCQAGRSCSKPARHFRLVFVQQGQTVTATTNDHGRYRVDLDPGRYGVRRVKPALATVPSGRFARRDFTYDAGIR